MKENSREEDIALIEKSLCDKDTIIQYHYWVGTDFLNAVERIVADYKRVLKENEKRMHDNITLKNFTSALFNDSFEKDYIPVRKIKDLMAEKEWAIKSYVGSEADYNQSQAVGAWFACQRLLEERKK